MLEEMEGPARSFGSWRVVTSAWLVAIVFAMLLGGVHALASLHTPPHKARLAGVVIPRHVARFVSANDVAASDWLEQARAEAYTGW